jgi:diguanylate cyclase
MSSDREKATESGNIPTPVPEKVELLSRALGQSERVQGKVERAAEGLSSVNAVLKGEITEGVPLAKVEQALNESEAIEAKVREAADELVAVNDALAEEIDERHHLEEQLVETNAALHESRAEARKSRHHALHDAVTGLPNLTLFNERLQSALAQAHRHAWRVAVMFIDLDDFKIINDTHGHEVGDRLLQMVGQRLQSAIRGDDTVSRRSGDEFLLLMLEAKDEPNVTAFAARIVEDLARPCEIDGLNLTMTASVGIALYPEGGGSARDLLKNADEAMYIAKKQKQGLAFFHG